MAVEYKDYYKILGLDKKASQDDIAKNYKKLARKHHPDLNQGDKKSEERFKEINEAHEVLKDPEKRRMYDQLGPNWQHGQNFQRPPGFENVRFDFGTSGFGASGFSDFFETLFGGGGHGFSGASFGNASFGGGQPFGAGGMGGGQAGCGAHGFNFEARPAKGRDVEAKLTLTLEEAFHGGKKNITLSGAPGQGPRSLELNIPAGVKNGARIRLTGQGDPSRSGGPAGDMFLKVSIQAHPHFSLDDLDVIHDLHIAPWDAALGATITVPTLSGNVELKIKPGTGSGKKLRMRGKGLGSGKNKGDQIVRVNIDVPEPGPEEVQLWEELRDRAGRQAEENE
ncbi:J domain-containing protein [Desulfovibrio sp. OttesenSCG-928-M16]|nr:J domain-containing protein [Desulfovibrio sp. OttesenSCG-928-M16]